MTYKLFIVFSLLGSIDLSPLSATNPMTSEQSRAVKTELKKEKRQAVANIRVSNTFLQEGGLKNFRLEANFVCHRAFEIGLHTGYIHPLRGGAIGSDHALYRHEANNTHYFPIVMQYNFFPFALWLKEQYSKDIKFDLWIGLKSGLLVKNELFAAGNYYYYEGGTSSTELTRVDYSRSFDERNISLLPEFSLSLGIGRTFRSGFGFFFEGSLGSHRLSLMPGLDLRWGLSYHFWQ